MLPFAIGFSLGAVIFDDHLGDYRWDERPALQLGVGAAWYGQRVGAGARVWRARTTQASGIPGATTAPRVNLTGIEVEGRVRVVDSFLTVWGVGRTGVLIVGYDPDLLTFSSGVPGAPVTVAYPGITEWTVGASAELSRRFDRVKLSVEAGATTFALDTSHRSGSEIVEARERFVNWDVRLGVAWMFRAH